MSVNEIAYTDKTCQQDHKTPDVILDVTSKKKIRKRNKGNAGAPIIYRQAKTERKKIGKLRGEVGFF
jgi:hypothetical protein